MHNPSAEGVKMGILVSLGLIGERGCIQLSVNQYNRTSMPFLCVEVVTFRFDGWASWNDKMVLLPWPTENKTKFSDADRGT